MQFKNKFNITQVNSYNNFRKKINLPEYKGYPGPNSNGFIRYLIESNGGKLDEIHGAYGQSIVEPYKEISK